MDDHFEDFLKLNVSITTSKCLRVIQLFMVKMGNLLKCLGTIVPTPRSYVQKDRSKDTIIKMGIGNS